MEFTNRISSSLQESEPQHDSSLDCIASSILPPVLAAIGPGGIDDLVPVLNLLLCLFLRLFLLLLVLLLFLLRFSSSLLLLSRLCCASAISGTLSIPNPVTKARRLKVLCTTFPFRARDERQDTIYRNGGGGATSNARSVPGEASASLDANREGALVGPPKVSVRVGAPARRRSRERQWPPWRDGRDTVRLA